MKNVRARLERERNQLIERLREMGVIDRDVDPRPSGLSNVFDEAESVQIDERREMGMMTRARVAERITRLTAALQRVEEGTYGVCQECGGRIEPARLRALPEAETCVKCQERLERSGRAA